jgi:hypothetical protein
MKDFGVLTLAHRGDYRKAIGLSLSMRVSNPRVPLAVACSSDTKELLAPYFDHVVEEIPGLRGFVHKVHLDRYSPFDRTLFLDSDVLVFKDLAPYVEKWANASYTACGTYLADGESCFGLDRCAVRMKLGVNRMVSIEGAGHAYFRKPQCFELFELAREITADYRRFADDARYADEDVIAIAMTRLELAPVPYEDFFARHLSAIPGTLRMDARRGQCEFLAVTTRRPFAPCMMHFAADEAPFRYTLELARLHRHFRIEAPLGAFVGMAFADLYRGTFRNWLSNRRRQLFAGRHRSALPGRLSAQRPMRRGDGPAP